MTAVLQEIRDALKAILNFIVWLGAAITNGTYALIDIAKSSVIFTRWVAAFEALFDPRGKNRIGNFVGNIIAGGLGEAVNLLNILEPTIETVISAFVASVDGNGPKLKALLLGPIGKVAQDNFTTAAANLKTIGPSQPENAEAAAAQAMAQAFGFGLASAGVTAAFESVFPEKLNTLNGVGPMLANMAGFEEISKEVLGALYKNAFGRSLEYQYRSLFKPELPDEGDAVTWHARRLLTDDQLKTLFGYSGLKPEYETAFVASAYRAIQPRALASLLVDSPFPTAQVQSALEFAGLRPADATFMLTALEWNSTRNVRQEYLSAAVRSTELGTMTPAELDSVLTDLNYSDQAKTWIQLTVATRKLEQLAELYRKSISTAYHYGTITDAQYVPSLEAIGIGEADAEAHYAVDSIAKTGKALLAAQKAAARLASQQMRAAGKAAIESFRQRQTDAAALEATLLAAGYDPLIATYTATLESLKRDEMKVFVYGIELPKGQAELLREQVGAIGKQTTAQLVTPQAAYTALVNLGIPGANATALVAGWSATKTTAADVGTYVPP